MSLRTWWDSANDSLTAAQKLVSSHPQFSYFLAMFAVELGLKHFLMINNDFIDAPKSQNGDRHHNLIDLANKAAKWLGNETNQIELINRVKNVETVQLISSYEINEYSCALAQGPEIKYLTDPKPSDLDAKQKIVEARETLDFLDTFF